MKLFSNTIRIKAEKDNPGVFIGKHDFMGDDFFGSDKDFEPFKNQFSSINGPFHDIHNANAYMHSANGVNPLKMGFTPHPESGFFQAPPNVMSNYANVANTADPNVKIKKSPLHVSKVKPEMGDDFNEIMAHIKHQGGNPYLVGGFVRDHLQGLKPKDKDVEVYGMDANKLDKILKQYGRTDDVGASFGVKKFTHPNGDDYDFSLPRRENKQGQGHKGFQVDVDPTMTTKEGSSRRDFTHGSMMMDPLTGQIIDHHGGLQDLKNKTLRHTGPAYAEDPLRVLRGMQFAGRFGHDMHPETAKLSHQLSSEYDTLSDDRIMNEWAKLAQKGEVPSKGLQVLKDTHWDEHYPELINKMGPEKMQAVDAIAKQMKTRPMSDEDKNVLFFTTLTNDMTPQESASFMQRVHMPQPVQKRVAALKRGLESPHVHSGNSTRANVQNLSHIITPENIDNLTEILRSIEHPKAQEINDVARQHGVHQYAPKPLISGEDLKAMGLKPGREFGEKLKDVYQQQLNGNINTPEEALNYIKRGM